MMNPLYSSWNNALDYSRYPRCNPRGNPLQRYYRKCISVTVVVLYTRYLPSGITVKFYPSPRNYRGITAFPITVSLYTTKRQSMKAFIVNFSTKVAETVEHLNWPSIYSTYFCLCNGVRLSEIHLVIHLTYCMIFVLFCQPLFMSRFLYGDSPTTFGYNLVNSPIFRHSWILMSWSIAAFYRHSLEGVL